MQRKALHPMAPFLLAGATVALAAVACGRSAPASGPASHQGAPSGAATIDARAVPKLGTVLVTKAGYTLYMFPPDRRGRVTCTVPAPGPGRHCVLARAPNRRPDRELGPTCWAAHRLPMAAGSRRTAAGRSTPTSATSRQVRPPARH